jgi:hypothetical protein
MTVNKGDFVLFHSFQNFHDISIVPTLQALEACDMSEAVVLQSMDLQTIQGGTLQLDNANASYAYTFNYTAGAAGPIYFVCGVGKHCVTGQKFTLTVLDTPGPAPKEHKGIVYHTLR